ncbi:6,7-dimethyl-8-ribityllumazine synthase [Pikeienuella sp. HZG-20]|uniref:6,7-dimethyl-8-ribityllumazine synthase n=1 Tax=Paludibacillus litoralis TaxID=3133267 RepID=UPI0030EBE320
MASTEHGPRLAAPRLDPPARLLIVAAPFYRGVADWLIEGAGAALDAAGAAHDLIEVPGALEIPTAIRFAERRFDGFVALGCVIRGETTHYETVCADSSHALMLLGVQRGLCVGNGILTVENLAQAEARADPARMNKGAGAAEAALHLIRVRRSYAAGSGSDSDIRLAGDPSTGAV